MPWWRRKRSTDDFRAEIEAHLALEADDLAAQHGMSPDDAQAAARRVFGNVGAAQERFYEHGRWLWLDRWRQHVVYGVRTLRHSPAFAISVIITLGVGVGLNTAIFTAFYALTIRPLPARDPERLVNVYQQLRGTFSREVHGTPSLVSYPEYLAYANTGAFVSATAYAELKLSVPGAASGGTRGELVTCNYFQTVGARMVLGRAFAADECARVGGEAVAVLSYDMWMRDFAADSNVVGRRVSLNAVPHTVVGVAEPRFRGLALEAARLWIPLTMQPTLAHGRDSVFLHDASWLTMVGRLAPGQSVGNARAALQVVARQRDALAPGRETQVLVASGALFNFPEVRKQGTLIIGFVLTLGALIVVIACANVMGLLLARGLQRRREVGIRLALGAGRGRLIEQLLTESALLAFAGGAVGFGMLLALPRVLARIPAVADLQVDASPDVRIFLYALAVTVFAALVFGLAPALQSTKLDLVSAFKGMTAGSGRRTRPGRLREVVIAVQVAASALLIVVATLFLRGARHAAAIDPGFTTRDVVAFSLDLPQLGYDDARARVLLDALAHRAQTVPGVQRVALAEGLPLLVDHTESIDDEDAVKTLGEHAVVHVNQVSGSYFATMGIAIVRGAAYGDTPTGSNGDGSAVVSASLARTLWGNATPLGRRIRVGGRWLQVTGVAADTRAINLGKVAEHFVYRSVDTPLYMKILVRGGALGASLPALQETTRSLDPTVTLQAQRIEERVALVLGPPRLAALVAGILGGLALLLGAVGVYGVVSYAASQRRREIAVRIALGATSASVVRLMCAQGGRAVIAGLIAGIVLAVAASPVLRQLLFGLAPLDPVSFGTMTSVLLLAAFAAMYGPARRAASVDPAQMLREE